jgi:hypothetical protein
VLLKRSIRKKKTKNPPLSFPQRHPLPTPRRIGLGRSLLVSVHGHPLLRTPAHLAVCRGGDGTATACTSGAGFFECQQLLSAEGLVVDLGGSFDQVLQVGAGEEVAEVDEFAVGFVLDCSGKVSPTNQCPWNI